MFGTEFRRVRRRLGWSQERLADALGVHRALFWRIEHDEQVPDDARMAEVCEIMRCDDQTRAYLLTLAAGYRMLHHAPVQMVPLLPMLHALIDAAAAGKMGEGKRQRVMEVIDE